MDTERRAVAYLRKSRVQPGHNDVSWETQESEVRSLAKRHGHGELQIMADWNRSGAGHKTAARAEYLKLRAMIEANEVEALYSYSLSRLGRSVGELSSLAELCASQNVVVRLAKEGELSFSNPYGKFQLHLLGALAQMEAELAQERARDTTETRRERGDHIGPAPYGYHLVNGRLHEDPGADRTIVLVAYQETGAFQAAARLLTEHGVPTKTGKGGWSASAVRSVVRREAPGLVTSGVSRGRSARGAFRLSGLLRCGGCGQVLTGRTFRGRYVSYSCRRAPTLPGHSRPWTVSEDKVMPAIRRAISRVKPSSDGLARVAQRLGRLRRRRARILEAFYDGTIDREARDAALRVVDASITKARRDETLHQAMLPVPLEGSPVEVNPFLRRLIEYVQLSESFAVSEVVFAVPEAHLANGHDLVERAQQLFGGGDSHS